MVNHYHTENKLNGIKRDLGITVTDYNLTERELSVLRLVCKGLKGSEIAKELILSPITVKNNCTNIYKKLGVRNNVEALVKSVELGLISLNGNTEFRGVRCPNCGVKVFSLYKHD